MTAIAYKNQLDLVRRNPNLLENYRFNKEASSSNHFERLRLNIAIYNDFKTSDFEIAAFLFTEESKWRRDAKDGEVDNLYFSAFILTLFQKPEIVWLFFDTKNIDFDSSIGRMKNLVFLKLTQPIRETSYCKLKPLNYP